MAPKDQPPSHSNTTCLMTYDRETQERVLPCVRQLQERLCGQGNSHPLFPVSCYPPTLSHHQSLLFLTFPFFLCCSSLALRHFFLPLSIICPTKAVKDANAIPRNCWACSLHTYVSFHLDVWKYGMYDSDTMIKNATLSTKFGQVQQPALCCSWFSVYLYPSLACVFNRPLPASTFCFLHLKTEDLTCDG